MGESEGRESKDKRRKRASKRRGIAVCLMGQIRGTALSLWVCVCVCPSQSLLTVPRSEVKSVVMTRAVALTSNYPPSMSFYWHHSVGLAHTHTHTHTHKQ